MQYDELRHHLSLAARAPRADALTPAAADRFSRVAARWLASWRPEKMGVALPACTCQTGRCAVCN